MAVKVVMLNTREDVITDVLELSVPEGDEQKVIGYRLQKPCQIWMHYENIATTPGNDSQLGHDGLIDSAVDTNPVYSACETSTGQNSPTNAFDGSLTTQYNGPNGGGIGVFDFTKIGGVAYTDGVECYINNRGAGQYDSTRFNGGSWVHWDDNGSGDGADNWEWVTLASGSGTMNTFEIRDSVNNSVSGAAEGSFKGLRINGDTILTDRGGNNFTVNNLATTATGKIYTSGSDWTSGLWDGSLSTNGGVTGQSYEELTDQSITVNTSFEIYTNDENGQVNTIKDGNGNEYQCDSDAGTGSHWRPLYNANSQSGTNYTGTLAGPIQVKVSYGGSHIYAVRVDGTILTDDPLSNIDSFTDTPTNYGTDTGAGGELRGNYPTMNPLDNGGALTLTQGNLQAYDGNANHNGCRATFKFPSTGKWYYEATIDILAGANCVGAATDAAANPGLTAAGTYYILLNSSGSVQRYTGGTHNASYSGTTTPAVGDIFQVAYDADAEKLWVGYNNQWLDSSTGKTGNPATGANATWTSVTDIFPATNQASSKASFNFGQRAFEKTVPSDFKALCTTNLDDTFSGDEVNNPSKYFDVVTRNGFGSAGGSVKGLNFQPDLMWNKTRGSGSHNVIDAVRGVSKYLSTDLTNAEATAANFLSSFDSDRYTMGSADFATGDTVVDWLWDAGTAATNYTTSDNSADLDSTVWKNPTAGFSIVSWVSDGTAGVKKVNHGLGVPVEFAIIKSRDKADDWLVWHKNLSTVKRIIRLNHVDAESAQQAYMLFSGTDSNTIFGCREDEIANDDDKMIMYAWNSIPGYSDFGHFVGNGGDKFVYTGFQPKFIIVKARDGGESWMMFDNKRDPYNEVDERFLASHNLGANQDQDFGDFLSNGFCIRNGWGALNQSGYNYLYMTWAEHPFKTSRAR